jgi:hypothetical protein
VLKYLPYTKKNWSTRIIDFSTETAHLDVLKYTQKNLNKNIKLVTLTSINILTDPKS